MPDEPQPDVEARVAAQKHLKSLEAFMLTPAFKGFKVGKQEEINRLQEQILQSEPTDLPQILKLLDLKSQYKVNLEFLSTFEDARTSLEAKIEQLLDLEDKAREQQLEKSDDR